MSVGDLWKRLEAFAQAHGRSLMLREGASQEAIAAAEHALGRPFPADYRASLLLHDGQEEDEEAFPALPGAGLLAPLDALIAQHAEVVEFAEEMREEDDYEGDGFDELGMSHWDSFHPDRIPLGGYPYFDGNASYLDFAIGPNGTEGQVIALVTEGSFVCLGASFEAALRGYVEALESGNWVYDADEERLFPKDRAPDDYPNMASLLAARHR